MIFYFLILVFFFLFNFNLFFFNEEFMMFISMLVTFYFCVVSASNFVNMYLFFKMEFLYFFFLYLIALVSNLMYKVKNLVYSKLLNLSSYILADLLSLFLDSSAKLNVGRLYLNSMLISNFFNYVFSNMLIDSLYINSNSSYFSRFSSFYHVLHNSSVKNGFVSSFSYESNMYPNFFVEVDFPNDLVVLNA